MLFLYNQIVIIAGFLLKITAPFNHKIKLFVDGRKSVFTTLQEKIKLTDRTIWFHAASLGEYEQGLPVIEKIKEKYPSHKIILSFFSPSGYEVRKNNSLADTTLYLPLDTKKNARLFLRLSHPEMAFFIKYEFWLNYLNELKNSNTPTYLISGVFRDNQVFFKWYGGLYKKALDTFTYFFVQNESSKNKIESIGYKNVIISGDTRFDRVLDLLKQNNTLDFIAEFKNNAPVIVIGSSWPKDEALLIEYINTTKEAVKFIIAPHNIKLEQIAGLRHAVTKKTVLFSEKEGKNLTNYDVFIIDTVGILTKIYSYATIAYVGGGFGKPGVHNILEPATFGIPVVIGSNYSHFAEATELVQSGGCISISNATELKTAFDNLILNQNYLSEKGLICKTYVQNKKGATTTIINAI